MQIHASKTPKLFKLMAMELHYEHYFLYVCIINNVYKNKTSKITCIPLPYIYSTEGQHLTSYLLVQVFIFFTRNASKFEIKSSGCYKPSEPTALKINNLDLASIKECLKHNVMR
jgi:hypothetical protein